MTATGTSRISWPVLTLSTVAAVLAGSFANSVPTEASTVRPVGVTPAAVSAPGPGCFVANCAPPESRPEFEKLFAYIERIPDPVLHQGDAATDQWVRDHPRSGDVRAAASADPVKCTAAVASILAGVLVPAARLLKMKQLIKELGGAVNAARLLVGAGTAGEKTEAVAIALASLVAELTGIAGVRDNCFS